jgi:hypothetical protein
MPGCIFDLACVGLVVSAHDSPGLLPIYGIWRDIISITAEIVPAVVILVGDSHQTGMPFPNAGRDQRSFFWACSCVNSLNGCHRKVLHNLNGLTEYGFVSVHL